MKFFTPELIEMNNTLELMEKGDILWRENCMRYEAYINSVRNRLPIQLLNVFGEEPFHDWVVREIAIKPGRKKKKLELTLSEGTMRAKLIFEDITNVALNSQAFSDCLCDKLCWLYSEMECLEDGTYRASILFDSMGELSVIFREFRLMMP